MPMDKRSTKLDYAVEQFKKQKESEEAEQKSQAEGEDESNSSFVSEENEKVTSINAKRQSTDVEEEPPNPEVFSKEGKIYKKSGEDEIEIGKEIEIAEIREVIDKEEEVKYILKFEFKGKEKEVEVPRETLGDSRELRSKLTGLGADVYSYNVSSIVKHLVNQEAFYSKGISNVHAYVGWDEIGSEVIFKHHSGVGIESKYVGDLDIEPAGDYQKWLELLREEVLGQTPLELALVFGFSAPLIGLVGVEIDVSTLVVHIYGDSTEGKTTAAMLAVSLWGNPDSTATGLHNDWNNTTNAFFGLLRNNNGLPVVYDEASMSGRSDYSTQIYKLASGREKNRMKKNAELKDQNRWRTTVISTGEHSLIGNSNQNMGIDMRVQEVGGITWTRNARNSEAIKRGILENYGHAGKKFVEGLYELEKEKILTRYNKNHSRFADELIEADKFAGRLSHRLGILLTTAELVREILGIQLNVKAIRELLLEIEQERSRDRDLGAKAYDYFREQVEIHDMNFMTNYGKHLDKVESRSTSGQIWGMKYYGSQSEKAELEEVGIFRNKFEELMIDGGFENPKGVLRKWKQKGILDHEDDRLSRRRKIKNKRKPVYVVKVREEYPQS